MTVSTILDITLNDGNTIPQLSFGVFQIEPKDTAEAVSEALEIGCRHIDTAEMYGDVEEISALDGARKAAPARTPTRWTRSRANPNTFRGEYTESALLDEEGGEA